MKLFVRLANIYSACTVSVISSRVPTSQTFFFLTFSFRSKINDKSQLAGCRVINTVAVVGIQSLGAFM